MADCAFHAFKVALDVGGMGAAGKELLIDEVDVGLGEAVGHLLEVGTEIPKVYVFEESLGFLLLAEVFPLLVGEVDVVGHIERGRGKAFDFFGHEGAAVNVDFYSDGMHGSLCFEVESDGFYAFVLWKIVPVVGRQRGVFSVVGVDEEGIDGLELAAVRAYLFAAFAGHFGEDEVVGKFVERDLGVVVPPAVDGDAIIRVGIVEPHSRGRSKVGHAEEEVVFGLVEGMEHGFEPGCSRIAFALRQFVVGRRQTVCQRAAAASGTAVEAVEDFEIGRAHV